MTEEEISKKAEENSVTYDNPLEYECGFIDGYHECQQDNKWNFVEKGEFPKEDIYLLIKLNDRDTCYKYCTGFWEKEEKCFHTLFCNNINAKDIIAWKEIKD